MAVDSVLSAIVLSHVRYYYILTDMREPVTLPERVLTAARALPEGTPVSARELLHLGQRAAVDQALSRLARQGLLLRVARGMYVAPVESRYGTRAPYIATVVEGLAAHRGERVARHGAMAANALGLTTQVPVREVFLTSGRSCHLQFGKQTAELRHAPSWQLLLLGRPAGDVIRAMAWLGPQRAGEAITVAKTRLQPSELSEVISARPHLPTWIAQEVSSLVTHG